MSDRMTSDLTVKALNMAIDRALFEALNGFDERFESWGVGEDSDLRDRAMRLRPRPRVKVLYGVNDVFHLWHPRSGRRDQSQIYYSAELGIGQADPGMITVEDVKAPFFDEITAHWA